MPKRYFADAADAAPQEAEPLLGLGRLARRRGDHDQAVAFFKAARAANPSHSAAAIETAVQLLDNGRLVEAREILYSQLRTNPRDHRAMMHLAFLHRKEGNRPMALAQFKAAHECQQNEPQILVEMAQERRALGNPRELEALLREALALQPEHQAGLEQLAEHHVLMENFEEALSISRRTNSVYPHRHGPYVRARVAAELGQNELVIKLLDQAEELTGPIPEIKAARANFYMQQRDWNAAYKILLDADAQAYRYPSLWILLVKLAITTGDYDMAEGFLPAEPSTVHDAARVHHFRGQIAENRWDLEPAVASYRHVLLLQPSDGGAQFDLAAYH